VFFNSLKYLRAGPLFSNIKVLEVGCGAGNNLWFLAEAGFRVFGLDGSEAAVKIATETLRSRNLDGSVEHGFFHSLPYETNSMDVVIDRESLYCGTTENIKLYLAEVNRVLRAGGVFISFRFSDQNPICAMLESGAVSGRQLDECTWTDLDFSSFEGTGVVNFLKLEDISTQYSFTEIKSVAEHSNIFLFGEDDSFENIYSEYIIVGVKK
jgi:ubiquinone/menaquinone biosynthesis C-methylase UbiE